MADAVGLGPAVVPPAPAGVPAPAVMPAPGGPQLAWLKYLYTNKTHDDFVHDLMWTTLIIFAYCCAGAYLKIRSNLQLVRTNWIQLRCNPAYIPFAGKIMKPTDMTDDAYTAMNFEYCVQNELKAISSDFMEPLYYTQTVAMSTLHGIANAMNDIRALISSIRAALSSIIADIMSRILNIMQPVGGMLLSARDMMGKIQGIMTASLYTLYGTYASIESGLKSTYEIIVIILIVIAAVIAALWIAIGIAAAFGPFGLAVLIPATVTVGVMTAIYIGIAIPLGTIATFLSDTMDIHGLSSP